MTDAKHTPGLWTVGRTLMTPQTRKWTKEQIAANDKVERRGIFARFTSQDDGRSRIRIAEVAEREEADANARLICAAPAYHDAVEAIVGREAKKIDGGGDFLRFVMLTPEEYDALLAAHAKAKGDAPRERCATRLMPDA